MSVEYYINMRRRLHICAFVELNCFNWTRGCNMLCMWRTNNVGQHNERNAGLHNAYGRGKSVFCFKKVNRSIFAYLRIKWAITPLGMYLPKHPALTRMFQRNVLAVPWQLVPQATRPHAARLHATFQFLFCKEVLLIRTFRQTYVHIRHPPRYKWKNNNWERIGRNNNPNFP